MHEEVEDAELPPADDGLGASTASEGERVDLTPGMVVTNNIRLSRKLGDGGMGTVWIADHLGLGSQVVIKFMSPSLARDERWVARFRREAELAARVRHPHVVQVFDHGVTATGLPFIVMELLEGHDLAQEIWDRGRLLPGEVSTIVLQIAKALQRVHELGFVHRDVKPENIYLCDLGSGEIFIKLLDFGIAKTRRDEAGSLTSTGMTMGTPYYMSPEVIVSAKNVDRKIDLWALAVVAFEALTGERPFVGETIAAVALKLHAEERPRPTALVPGLPSDIDDWFIKALARDPERRFPDARSMARAFAGVIAPARTSLAPAERVGRDETLAATTTQVIETPRLSSTRRRTLMAGSAALAIAIVALAWTSKSEPPPPAVAQPTIASVEPTPAPIPSAEPQPVVVAPRPSAVVSAAPKPIATSPKKPKPVVVKSFNDIE